MRAPLVMTLVGLGCSQRALVGLDDLDAAAADYSLAPVDGAGYVHGTLYSHAAFDTVGRVYWFDAPGDSSIAVYIFEDMPACADLSKNGYWPASSKVRPTVLLGLTTGGNKPGTYQVVTEKPPREGNAYLQHIIDQADPVIDSEGRSGTVTITSVKPGESVSGAFEATFSTGTLQGSFNAVPCATGVRL